MRQGRIWALVIGSAILGALLALGLERTVSSVFPKSMESLPNDRGLSVEDVLWFCRMNDRAYAAVGKPDWRDALANDVELQSFVERRKTNANTPLELLDIPWNIRWVQRDPEFRYVVEHLNVFLLDILCNIRWLQREPEFRYVAEHLDEFLHARHSEDHSSLTFSTMIWRATFLFGNRNQINTAFERCLAHGQARPLIAGDLASSDAPEDWEHLLLDPHHEEITKSLILALAAGGPLAFGDGRHVPLLARILDKHPSVGMRAIAAYALARWDHEPSLVDRAMSFLESTRQSSSESAGYWDDLQRQLRDTGRWQYNNIWLAPGHSIPVPPENSIGGPETREADEER